MQLIAIIATIVLIGGYAYDNRIRGSHDKPWWIPGKWAAYAWFTIMMSLATWAVYGKELFDLVPIFGMEVARWKLLAMDYPITWLCFSFGWGDFFPHGRKDLISDMSSGRKKEFWLADTLADKIHGELHSGRTSEWLKKWQTTAMNFRFGLTFGLLKFPWLAFTFSDWRIALLGIPMFFSGYLYRFAFVKHDENSIPKAEMMVGALLGLMTSGILWLRVRKKDRKDVNVD